MVSNILYPGDDVEIREIRQIKQQEAAVVPHVYKSKIQEIYENEDIDISMPMEEGKYILLRLGGRYEFSFYTKRNLFRGVGQVKERFKANNIHMLKIELKTQLRKLQRREYYRFPCMMDIKYYRLSEDLLKVGDADQILEVLQNERALEDPNAATILDISGGGARIVSKEKFEDNEYILMGLQLVTENIDKEYCIIGRVVSCREMIPQEKRYEARIEFIMRDHEVREDIIRYIFEEERRIRRRENG
ncbi:MAG: flagellar brake protein [Lachnospiraceae bacterium]|nr:flagellar brake protein [Lachnospiraceae bacterium]